MAPSHYLNQLSIRPQGTRFIEILFEVHKLSFKKMHLKISFVKCQLLCPSLNVLLKTLPDSVHFMSSHIQHKTTTGIPLYIREFMLIA